MRIALDSNVIGYAEGLDDPDRQALANDVLQALDVHDLAMPLQVAAEFHRLLMRRRKIDAREASETVAGWMALLPHHPETTTVTFDNALSLARDHHFQIFDAVILSAAAEADCRLLLSEDMQDGFVWRGVTVANPFAATLHPLLADALRG